MTPQRDSTVRNLELEPVSLLAPIIPTVEEKKDEKQRKESAFGSLICNLVFQSIYHFNKQRKERTQGETDVRRKLLSVFFGPSSKFTDWFEILYLTFS